MIERGEAMRRVLTIFFVFGDAPRSRSQSTI
jgi:hypothetical protein